MKLSDYVEKLPWLYWKVKGLLKTQNTGNNIKKMGVLDYNDLATATTPIALEGGNSYVYLPNDELGPFTNKSYLPEGVTDVWDTDNNQFDFSQLPLGAKIEIRLDLIVTTTAPNQTVKIALEVGIGGSSYDLAWKEANIKTSGTYQLVKSNFIYMGDNNTKNNPAKFKIRSDGDADVQVNGWACAINLY